MTTNKKNSISDYLLVIFIFSTCSLPVIGFTLLVFNIEIGGSFIVIFLVILGIGETFAHSNNRGSQSIDTTFNTDADVSFDEYTQGSQSRVLSSMDTTFEANVDKFEHNLFVFRKEKMVKVNTHDSTKIDLKLIIKTINVPDNLYFSSQYQNSLNEMIENFKDEYELYESNLKTLEIVFNDYGTFTSLNYIYEDGSNKLIQTYKI